MSKELWLSVMHCPKHTGHWGLAIHEDEAGKVQKVLITRKSPPCCDQVRVWANSRLTIQACSRLIGVFEDAKAELGKCTE